MKSPKQVVRFARWTTWLLLLGLIVSSPGVAQENCGQGEDLTNDQKQDAFDKAVDHVRDEFYDGTTEPNTPDWFEDNLRKRMTLSHGTPGGTGSSEIWTLGEAEILAKCRVFPDEINALAPCTKKCPKALEAAMKLIMEHEYHNWPEDDGGSGYEDDPEDDPETPDEDESDAATPIDEIANTFNTMLQACSKAGEEKEKENDGDEETNPDECTIEAMCAIFDELKKDMEGEAAEGEDQGNNPDGYGDEVCAHEASGDEDPDLPLPPTSGEGDECELNIEPCPSCPGADEDAGSEGDGAGGGGEPTGGGGGSGSGG